MFVVLEYMVGGTLQSYLRASRADHGYNNLHSVSTNLSPRDLTIFALQVANGMDFLAKNGVSSVKDLILKIDLTMSTFSCLIQIRIKINV